MTLRWNTFHEEYVEDKRVDEILNELDAVLKKHDVSLSHEDLHGAFIITNRNLKYRDWLLDAQSDLKIQGADQ